MDFSLGYSKKQEEFAQEVRRWLEENMPEGWVNRRDPGKMTREQWEKRRELARKLGTKGWLYAQYPVEYGGGGLDASRYAVLAREFAAKGLALPPHYDSGALAAAAILATGTDEQKKRFLPPILKGEAFTWQLFTEPEAGTDEANQQTNALRHTREKEYFIINGQKIFVGSTFGPPDQFLLLTRGDLQAARHENLAMFLAPANLPGITINRLDLFTSGLLSQVNGASADVAPGQKNQVFFDDVKVHESYLIGGERDGWRVTGATLAVEHGERDRAGGSGAGDSGARWISPNVLVDKFLDQCRKNPAVKESLKSNPQLVEDVVDAYIDAQIERLFSIRNAAGKGGRYGGPQTQLRTKMSGSRLIAQMARVLGPYNFTDDAEWGLDDGIFEVGQRAGLCFAPAGTPEASKIIISRGLGIGR
jgi:alkylation response protein AidB-like acyl-CoA dehydrogenase